MKTFNSGTRALFVAGLFGPLSVVPISLIATFAEFGLSPEDIIRGTVLYSVVGIPIAYLLVVAWGIPMYFALNRTGHANYRNICLISIVPVACFQVVAGLPIQFFVFLLCYSMAVALITFTIGRLILNAS